MSELVPAGLLVAGDRFRTHPTERWRTFRSSTVVKAGRAFAGFLSIDSKFDRTGPPGSIESSEESFILPTTLVELEARPVVEGSPDSQPPVEVEAQPVLDGQLPGFDL